MNLYIRYLCVCVCVCASRVIMKAVLVCVNVGVLQLIFIFFYFISLYVTMHVFFTRLITEITQDVFFKSRYNSADKPQTRLFSIKSSWEIPIQQCSV